MIPLVHDFCGSTVLIFGGGSVGARRARYFAREASVIVVSPAFADREFGDAERVRADPSARDVEAWVVRADPALVVAATDDEAINDAIETAGRAHGALVNRADRVSECDPWHVDVPATVRDDPVVVAIATGGSSPTLSGYLRERIEDDLSGAGKIASLAAEIRDKLREQEISHEERHEALRGVVTAPELWEAVQDGRTDADVREVAWKRVRETLPEKFDPN